jgi:hypothetical protein
MLKLNNQTFHSVQYIFVDNTIIGISNDVTYTQNTYPHCMLVFFKHRSLRRNNSLKDVLKMGLFYIMIRNRKKSLVC